MFEDDHVKALLNPRRKTQFPCPAGFSRKQHLTFKIMEIIIFDTRKAKLIHVDSSESYSLNSSYVRKKITQTDYFREKETKSNLKEHCYLAEKGLKERPEEKEIL